MAEAVARFNYRSEHRTEIDHQLQILGIDPLYPLSVAVEKKVALRAALRDRHMPRFWRPIFHNMLIMFLLALGTAAFVGEIYAQFHQSFFVIIFGLAFVACAVVTIIVGWQEVPYWNRIPLEQFKREQTDNIPPNVLELIDELKMRVPKTVMFVEYLAFTTDPYLIITDGIIERYIVQWK